MSAPVPHAFVGYSSDGTPIELLVDDGARSTSHAAAQIIRRGGRVERMLLEDARKVRLYERPARWTRVLKRIGRFRRQPDGKRTRCVMHKAVRRFVVRQRSREQAEAEARSVAFRQWNDERSALISEWIDDALRHAHARDGISCPICGAAAGEECTYGGGYGSRVGPTRPAPARQYPGKVHTRRLVKFHLARTGGEP